ETTKRLERIFTDIAERPPGENEDVQLAEGYSDQAAALLDELF
ncbi:MAG: hypothetical protein ACJAQ3_002944, partial [Planctomycetota bacterium]